MADKSLNWIYALIIITITLVVMMFIQEWLKFEKERDEEIACYRTLYNEDIIGKGCDKYFYQDEWYIEYRQLEKVEK